MIETSLSAVGLPLGGLSKRLSSGTALYVAWEKLSVRSP
jgi:hypothetical protein